MKYSIQDYQNALQKAQAAGDAEAVAYFQEQINRLSKPDYEKQVAEQKAGSARETLQAMKQQPVTLNPGTWARALPEPALAGVIGIGRGMNEVWQGAKNLTGFGSGEALPDDGYSDLEAAYPKSTAVGQIVGQAAPFLAGGLVSTGSKAANIGIQGLLGGIEGAAIASGTGGNVAQAAGIGGAVGGAVEAVSPLLGRLVSRFGIAKLVDNAGNPTDLLRQQLAQQGVNPPENVMPYLANIVKQYGENVSLPSAEKAARFESMGIPYSAGDVAVGPRRFDQQFNEDRLSKMTDMPEAADFRQLKLDQSRAIVSNLSSLADGSPDMAAENIKKALGQRKITLNDAQRNLYGKLRLAEESLGAEAGNLTAIPMPEPKTVARIYQASPSEVNKLNDVLVRFGINQDPAAVEAYASSIKNVPMGAALNIEPLSLANFEDFRQAIKAIERGDQSGNIKVLTGDILRNADDLVDQRLATLETDPQIGKLAKEARAVTRQIKTEFSPDSITGRLIATKRDGVTPVIESSAVLRNLLSTGKEERLELLERTVGSLSQSGVEGKRAIADLQAAYVARALDDALSAASRNIDGERVVSGESMQKALGKLSDRELGILFGGNRDALNKIKALNEIAIDLTPPASARSFGSSSTIIDLLKKASSKSASIPGGGAVNLLLENYIGAVEKAGSRKAAEAAVKGLPQFTPKQKQAIEFVNSYMPAIAAYTGIKLTEEEEENEPLR